MSLKLCNIKSSRTVSSFSDCAFWLCWILVAARRPSPAAGHGPLIVVASHSRAQAGGREGFSGCGSWALEHRLRSCVVWGSVAPWHVGPSGTRDRTCVSCIGCWFFTPEPPGKSLFPPIFDILQEKWIFYEPNHKVWVTWCLNGHFWAEASRNSQADQIAWLSPGWLQTEGRGSLQLAEAGPLLCDPGGGVGGSGGHSLPGPSPSLLPPSVRRLLWGWWVWFGPDPVQPKRDRGQPAVRDNNGCWKGSLGKIFEKRILGIPAPAGQGPQRGQVRSMNGYLQPELTPKGQAYSWNRMPPTYPSLIHRWESKDRSAVHQIQRGVEPSFSLTLVQGVPCPGGGGYHSHCVLWDTVSWPLRVCIRTLPLAFSPASWRWECTVDSPVVTDGGVNSTGHREERLRTPTHPQETLAPPACQRCSLRDLHGSSQVPKENNFLVPPPWEDVLG